MPGREGRRREAPLTSIEDMAEHIVASLPQDSVPIALFGHCSGGSIAFRVAQLLEQAGSALVVRLITANATAPGHSQVSVRGFNSEELFHELVEGGAMEDDPRQKLIFELMEPAIRADFNALENWHKDDFGKISAPILAIRGAEDHLFETADNMLWQGFTTAGFSHSTVSGGHFLLGDAMPGLLTVIGNDLATIIEDQVEADFAESGSRHPREHSR